MRGDKSERCVSAAELREIYSHSEEQAVDRTARLLTPPRLLAQLVHALHFSLEPFIDPDTDEVGRAFAIEDNFRSRSVIVPRP